MRINCRTWKVKNSVGFVVVSTIEWEQVGIRDMRSELVFKQSRRKSRVVDKRLSLVGM